MNHPTCGALPTHICMQGQEAKSVGQAAGGWQPGKESMRSHGCLNLDLRQGFRVWGFKTPNPKPQTPIINRLRRTSVVHDRAARGVSRLQHIFHGGGWRVCVFMCCMI